MRAVLNPLVLALIFMIVVDSWNLPNVMLALTIGVVASFLSNPSSLLPKFDRFRALTAVPWFMFGIVIEIFRGSWQMLLVLTGIRTWKTIGYVELPLQERTRVGAMVNALVATISPGSVLIDIDEEKQTMLFNVIDARKPDAFRESMDRFYYRFQKRLIP